jgi:hypothetical protein
LPYEKNDQILLIIDIIYYDKNKLFRLNLSNLLVNKQDKNKEGMSDMLILSKHINLTLKLINDQIHRKHCPEKINLIKGIILHASFGLTGRFIYIYSYIYAFLYKIP